MLLVATLGLGLVHERRVAYDIRPRLDLLTSLAELHVVKTWNDSLLCISLLLEALGSR